MITVDLVLSIQDEILREGPGLKGAADKEKLESALARIDNWKHYQQTENVFDLAALYAEAIAKAHAFLDGNKRTAMVTMLIYLDIQGIEIRAKHGLDDVMVDLASGELSREQLSKHLRTLVDND